MKRALFALMTIVAVVNVGAYDCTGSCASDQQNASEITFSFTIPNDNTINKVILDFSFSDLEI